MQDLRAKFEKLSLEAEDCELISRLTTDLKKRVFFAKLAVELKALARDVEQAIATRAREENGDGAEAGHPFHSALTATRT
jgi:hypothetical protein